MSMAESNPLVTATVCASSTKQMNEDKCRDDDNYVSDENPGDGALPTIAPPADWVGGEHNLGEITRDRHEDDVHPASCFWTMRRKTIK